MGYSGSTFFTTTDGAYIVKSIPRHFEHSFFKNDLLLPYAEHMENNLSSLLVRITDFLECVQWSVGTIFGMAPSHHIIMDNIKFGESADNTKWETYDLKPMSYFYPERDVAGGVLTSEATKSKLADDFQEKVVLTLDQAEDFKMQLEKDTAFLAKNNAVDYSLFLIRIPAHAEADPFSDAGENVVQPARPKYMGIVMTFRTILREEGWRAFYAGLGTNMMRAVPAATVTMLTYEAAMRQLNTTKLEASILLYGQSDNNL